MAQHASTPLPETSLPTEVSRPTLPAFLQLVHSSSSLAHKHAAKPARKAKKPMPVVRADEWYECPDRTLPSVSSF